MTPLTGKCFSTKFPRNSQKPEGFLGRPKIACREKRKTHKVVEKFREFQIQMSIQLLEFTNCIKFLESCFQDAFNSILGKKQMVFIRITLFKDLKDRLNTIRNFKPKCD